MKNSISSKFSVDSIDTTLKKMANKVGLEEYNKNFQNCIDNHLQQYYFTTPGFLLLDSHQRRGFESPSSDSKQGNEDNSEMSLANTY
jgi:hypothetical protein